LIPIRLGLQLPSAKVSRQRRGGQAEVCGAVLVIVLHNLGIRPYTVTGEQTKPHSNETVDDISTKAIHTNVSNDSRTRQTDRTRACTLLSIIPLSTNKPFTNQMPPPHILVTQQMHATIAPPSYPITAKNNLVFVRDGKKASPDRSAPIGIDPTQFFDSNFPSYKFQLILSAWSHSKK
jgi:hypothetical protein